MHKCPICHKVFTDEKYVPFCSKRCADVDLGRWFNGSYAVASEDLDEMETIELYEAMNEQTDNEQ
ncbi:MAG: DNA gyrase inhibitor YacG [Alphaproteobacteria bacterium]|nr:DNA gyrase inhibitor YacG [Alphaproteobacteria bacterium]MBR3662567.1 DNA gyrase inhibitor YacG [Alphaproteobacteria bacterium]